MNYNELEFLNEEFELIENEMLEALADDEIGYFNYLRSNLYTEILLDSMAKNMETYNDEEFMEGIEAIIGSLNLDIFK